MPSSALNGSRWVIAVWLKSMKIEFLCLFKEGLIDYLESQAALGGADNVDREISPRSKLAIDPVWTGFS
ncbi:MAG: hypothetical protein HC781_13855 [Leptolyngbyaceae cyanobacterium CSU_1_4]|nr:hypothetical protein [Leptolyngbyaceae cyanobacterium CSU_1_4]